MFARSILVRAVWTLAGLGLATLAASRPPVPQERYPPSSSDCPLPTGRAVAETACPDWRWIGIKERPEERCPPRSGWLVRPLFLDPDPKSGTVPPELRPFCLYEHPREGEVLSPATLPGLIKIDRDCAAVLPAAPDLVTANLPRLEARFLHASGRIPTSASPGPAAVRLAFLDTAPTRAEAAASANDRSPHGYSLASMARKLVCAGGPCAATAVTSRLALSWVIYVPYSREMSFQDTARGGFVGMIGELAEAIRGEVVDWQASAPSSPLILNLSLGWNGLYGGGLEASIGDMPAEVQAVYAALGDASSKRVSVLAAAGNQTRGPDPAFSTGPLLPAAWERRNDLPIPAGAQRPLVHAVGAVDIDGAPLTNARYQAEPRLVAFGDHAVVAAQGSLKPTAMLTGSSVATAIASAAMAWVRSYSPDLNPTAAADRLYASGKLLDRTAEFGSNPQRVRQIRVSAAARRACRSCQGPGCPSVCPPAPSPAPPPFTIDVSPFQRTRKAQIFKLPSANPVTHPACPPLAVAAARRVARRDARPERFHFPAGTPVFRCPQWLLYDTNLNGMTGPQPGSDPCSTCTLGPPGGSWTAYIEIDEDYVGQLSSPVLRVGDRTYPLVADLSPGAKIRIDHVEVGPDEEAYLSFVVNGSRSVTSLFLRTDPP